MRPIVYILLAVVMAACASEVSDVPKDTTAEWVDLSKRDKPPSVTPNPWKEVVIGVPDLDDVPRLFTEIGGFEPITEGIYKNLPYPEKFPEAIVLRRPGLDGGYIRFEETEPDAIKTRPFGSRSWDTGCYFSIMMRAKNIPSIIEDAKALGWEPFTEMAYLEFGPSKLNIVVLGHKKTGIQVQLYERLTTPLPEAFPDFERLSRPFNMMQMVRSTDAAYDFYQQALGFETFYYGKPYLSKEPVIMPLGVPKELTTTVPYQAAITTPQSGLEWGRMEMIQVMMEGGQDLSKQCQSGNIGITEVRFEVENLHEVWKVLKKRGLKPTEIKHYGLYLGYLNRPSMFSVQTPDGAIVSFYEQHRS